MSIMLATMLKKSTAIVNNPQINVREWYISDRMISACFDNLDLDSILKFYGHQFDVIKYFEKENYVPPIKYIANIGEKKDIENHLWHFIKGIQPFENLNEKINIVLYYADEDHNGILSSEEVIKLIKDHFNQNYEEVNRLKYKVNEYENSTSWKITAPLQKIGAKIKNNKIQLKVIKNIKNRVINSHLYVFEGELS